MRREGRGRRIAGALALFLGSLLFALVLAEGALAIVDLPPRRTEHQRLFIEHDSVRGWRNIPGASGRYITHEFQTRLEYDAHGVRGGAPPFEKPPNAFRVLMLGDSFVEAYTVDVGERSSDRLAQALLAADTARQVEVVPLGTAGYSTDQELLWLEREGMRWAPDVVVLMFYVNDVWYNARKRYWRGEKPLFVRQGDSLVLTNVPVPLVPPDTAPRPGDHALKRAERWVRARSRVHALFARAVRSQTLAGAPRARRAGGRAEPRDEFAVFLREPPAAVDSAWQITEALVDRVRRVARDGGADFLLFHIPIRWAIYPDDPALTAAFGDAPERMDRDAVRRRVRAMCDGRALRCVDATGCFQAAADSAAAGERLYYRSDFHWTARGHALAGRVLAEALRGRPVCGGS